MKWFRQVFLGILLVFGLITFLSSITIPKTTLETKILELESYISMRDSLNPEVSMVPVAWHIDHAYITINEIYNAMKQSDPNTYKRRFSFGRTVLFTFNKIPRGRASSPENVRPAKIIYTDTIYKHLEESRGCIKNINHLDPKAHFKHPVAEILNKKQAIRFLNIHTEHHLKIIRDILGNYNSYLPLELISASPDAF